MRLTGVVLRQNSGHLFRVFWVSKCRRRVPDTGAAAILAARGLPLVNPKEILTPPYPKNDGNIDFPSHLPDHRGVPRDWTAATSRIREPTQQHKTPCNVFTNHFSPVMGLDQAQLLTNTVVRPQLPPGVLAHAAPTTPEEDDTVREAILHAHLQDSTQQLLPRVLDVINRPGMVSRREYGIPLSRSNKSLTYQLLLLLDQMTGGDTTDRCLVEDTITRVTLPHPERLMQLQHRAGFIVSSPRPLPRVAEQEEVAGSGLEDMPDIYPVSPFVSVRPPLYIYNSKDQYGVPSSRLHPHTIIVHNNAPRLRSLENNFQGMTLLYAFSHAAAYATTTGKSDEELAENPVVVQVVHCNRQQYHLGVLQLNTLDLGRPDVRNLFWTQPWGNLFSSCYFKGAQPELEGYNSDVFSLLKGLHMQGVEEGRREVLKEGVEKQ